MSNFNIENLRSIEKIAKEQTKSFKILIITFCITILLLIIGTFYIVSSNQDRVYVFDGTYGTKRVLSINDKAIYFTTSFTKLLFEGDKYTFKNTTQEAYNLCTDKARTYIKNLVNAKFYENISAQNMQLLCNIDSVKIITENPLVVHVFTNGSRINEYGTVYKQTDFKYLLSKTNFSDKNPLGLKVEDIVLMNDAVIDPNSNKK
jgi:hypothetical protein